MKRLLSVALAVAVVVVLAGAALAFMGPAGGPMGMGGGMGPGMMGAAGQAGCPGLTGTGAATQTTITEEKAKELAQQYTDQYLKGFTIERVLPFTGMHHTMYNVELKGPKGEVRTLHVNPWGNVIPFGSPLARTE
ncbi:MAG TPA: hypothetical protein VJO34_06720 [Methylomirabilota bacterium]|nr:hypothetical protein [Methylomirabilota bacterium]